MKKEIKKLECEDMPEVSALVFRTFYEFISKTYTEEGLVNFRNFIDPVSLQMNLYDGGIDIYGFLADGALAGVLGRRGSNHICMFFVAKEYHRQGIGRELFSHFLKYANPGMPVTVNASDYAIRVYERLGFVNNGERREEDGIISTPMIRYPAAEEQAQK